MGKIMTVTEVASELKMSPSTIYRYTEMGKIPSIKVGNRTRVLEDQLNDYIISCKKDNLIKKEQDNENKEK
jgi:excisionase family DNA binding protein